MHIFLVAIDSKVIWEFVFLSYGNMQEVLNWKEPKISLQSALGRGSVRPRINQIQSGRKVKEMSLRLWDRATFGQIEVGQKVLIDGSTKGATKDPSFESKPLVMYKKKEYWERTSE